MDSDETIQIADEVLRLMDLQFVGRRNNFTRRVRRDIDLRVLQEQNNLTSGRKHMPLKPGVLGIPISVNFRNFQR